MSVHGRTPRRRPRLALRAWRTIGLGGLKMQPDQLVSEWKRRIIAISSHAPPADYMPDSCIERDREGLIQFQGYSPGQILATEERLYVEFPVVFRAFMRAMGRSRGALFAYCHMARIGDFEKFRAIASSPLGHHTAAPSLPREAIVFLMGRSSYYFQAVGGFDSAVFSFWEEDPTPRMAFRSFADMVEADLDTMANTYATGRFLSQCF